MLEKGNAQRRLWVHGKPMLEQVCWLLHGVPMLLEKFENCLMWEGPHKGEGKSVRKPHHEEEGVATIDELTTFPVPLHHCGMEREKSRSKAKPRKNRGWEESIEIWVYFPLSYPDVIAEERSNRAALVGTWPLARLNPPHHHIYKAPLYTFFRTPKQ
ncbi:hypothetical protein TURU_114879 [Turdus rufiventris]|nr:hypothetical protein TURU_114879 [Turdus rufiventris]